MTASTSALPTATPPSPTAMIAIRIVFALEATSIGAFLPRLADIRDALSINDAQLGLALIGLPIGTMIGLLVAARVAGWLGLRNACMVAGAAFPLSIIPVGLAGSLPAMVAALFVAGLAISLLEVSMNTKAGVMEKASGRRIMSQCHGFWSLGAVVGAAVSGLFGQFGVAPPMQFLLTAPVFALIAVFAASRLAVSDGEPPAGPSFFTLPDRKLLLLCIMPIGIMAAEGGMMDWSAVFARDVLESEPAEASAVFAVFAGFMAITRLGGDWLATRFGAPTVVLLTALAASVGLLLVATAPNMMVLYLAAALTGAGTALAYPLAVSAAAASPGRRPEDNVAAVSFIAFSVFLAVPPVIGFLSETFGLRIGLAVLIPATLSSAALFWTVRPRTHD